MARRGIRGLGVGGFGVGRLLLIGAVACFVLSLFNVDANIDLVKLGLALGFASFLV